MKMDKAEWWKGSFPTWIAAILLAIIGWFAKEAKRDYDNYKGNNEENHRILDKRVTANEMTGAILIEQNRNIIAGQNRIEDEIGKLRDEVRKKP